MAQDLVRLAEQGERLKKLRRPIPGTAETGRPRYEIGQQQAADAAGVILRSYQAYEGGTSDIGWDALRRLAAFFGVSPAYIQSGETGMSQLDRIEAMLRLLVEDRGLSLEDLADESLDALDPTIHAPPRATSRGSGKSSRTRTA